MLVIAIVDLIFSAIGFVLSSLGIAAALLGAKRAVLAEGSMGIAHVTDAQQTQSLHLLGFSLFGLLVAIAALAAGLALLFMRRPARRLNQAYAILAIIRGLILFSLPAISVGAMAKTAALPSRLIGLCLSLIYPGILLTLFSRPAWKAPFQKPLP